MLSYFVIDVFTAQRYACRFYEWICADNFNSTTPFSLFSILFTTEKPRLFGSKLD